MRDDRTLKLDMCRAGSRMHVTVQAPARSSETELRIQSLKHGHYHMSWLSTRPDHRYKIKTSMKKFTYSCTAAVSDADMHFRVHMRHAESIVWRSSLQIPI